MIDKVVALVEGLPNYRHCMSVPNENFIHFMRERGYFVEAKNPGKSIYYWMSVSKNQTFKDGISYMVFPVMKPQSEISLIVKYHNGKLINVEKGPATGNCLVDAFIGYDETCKTLPEIWSKILNILWDNPSISVTYIFHKETTVEITGKPERLC